MTRTHSFSTNRYGVNSFVVSTTASNGDYTTLAGAMADAVSGDTIFLRDSVTENVTITPGVNIAAWSGSALNTPSITGTLTMTGAGTSTISGIRLVTNSAAIIAVTGSAASVLNIKNCYLDITNNTGITFSSSNSDAIIFIEYCRGNIGTTGITLYTHSSAGFLALNWSGIGNSGATTTASNNSAGSAFLTFSSVLFPFSTSSTGNVGITHSSIDNSATNTICLTTAGTGASSFIENCRLSSGSGSSVSIGSGTTVRISEVSTNSSNGNAITGAGTLNYSPIEFLGSGKGINTTTRNPENFGLWTPTVTGGTIAGTTTYTSQQGYYTIVGNIVFVEFQIVITAATGTGNATFGGLPFIVKNLTNYNPKGVGTCASSVWTWPALTTSMLASFSVNSTNAFLTVAGSGATGILQMANGAATFAISGWYQI